MRNKILIFAVLISLIFGGFTLISSRVKAENTSWPMFMHDIHHSGLADEVLDPHTLPLNAYSWRAPLIQNSKSSPVVAEGKVFVGDYSGRLYAFNVEDGTKIWDFATENYILGAPLYNGGRVYFASGGDPNRPTKVYCLDANTGSKIWEFSPLGQALSSPIYVNGYIIFGTVGNPSYVYAVDATNGNEFWKREVAYHEYSSPTVIGGTVYVSTFSGLVYAINLYDGNILFTYQIPGITSMGNESSISTDGTYLFVTSLSNLPDIKGKIIALSATLSPVWEFSERGNFVSTPAVDDTAIYVGDREGHFYAINKTTGQKLWQFDAEGPIDGSAAVSGDFVYFTSRDKKIYALNKNTGEKIWEYATDGEIYSSPAIAQGGLFVASSDHYLYAFFPTANFYLNVEPEGRVIYAGESTTFTISFTPYGTFAGEVTLSLKNPPNNLTYSFSPQTLESEEDTATLTVTALPQIVPNVYFLEIEGRCGNLVATKTVTLDVRPQVQGSFTLNAQPPQRSAYQGESATFIITMTAQGGFNVPVNLTLVNPPPNTTFSFSPEAITPTVSSVLTINVGENTPPGPYSLTVAGSGGGKRAEVNILLTVVIMPTGDFKIEVVPPTSRTITQGGTSFFTVKIERDEIFKGDVSLSLESASGPLPNGIIPTFSPATVPSLVDTAYLKIETNSSLQPSTYMLVVKGESEGKIRTANIVLVIMPPSNTTLTLIPSLVNVNAGDSFKVDVKITGVNDLVSLNMDILFDPNLVQVDEIRDGGFMGSDGISPIIAYKIHNQEGYVSLQAVRPALTGVSGDGVVFTIIFRATNPGNGTLQIANLSLYNSTPLYISCQSYGNTLQIGEGTGVKGDVNGDKIVDGYDLVLLMQAFGSVPGEENWNPNCDFNGDLRVDGIDLVILAQNWGKVVP
ncbi:MAG: PQQ-binding-like beta-propeller repeat protein [Caldisericia bacterium]|nr:PQQ-binding-like beta-propeller repeat protein [Caldisericia bacterium]